MYLSRIYLNSRRQGAQKLLAHPQAMHAAVQACFPPDALASAGGRALWRVDRTSDQRVALYVVSPIEPDMTHVVEQAGWQTGEMWQTKDYRNALKGLEEGQVCSFRLRANPVRHGRVSADAETKPLAHVTAAQQQQWFLDRVESWGLRPIEVAGEPDVVVTHRETLRFIKGGHRVTLGTAVFEGTVEIVDPERVTRVLTEGVGRAKAYGCGLFTFAPAKVN